MVTHMVLDLLTLASVIRNYHHIDARVVAVNTLLLTLREQGYSWSVSEAKAFMERCGFSKTEIKSYFTISLEMM